MLIFLPFIIAGFLVGRRRWWVDPPRLRLLWLVCTASVLQLVVLRWPISPPILAVTLVTTQVIIFIFIVANYQHRSLWILELGLGLNLLVISINGGMPLSPEMVGRLIPQLPGEVWEVGSRFMNSKDIILLRESTVMWSLSDRFFLAVGSYRVAYSLGDIFIGIGTFLFLSGLEKRTGVFPSWHLNQADKLTTSSGQP